MIQIGAAYLLLNWVRFGQILVKRWLRSQDSLSWTMSVDSRQSVRCCGGLLQGRIVTGSTLNADSWQRGTRSVSSALSILTFKRAKNSRQNIYLVTFRWWKDALVTTRPLLVSFRLDWNGSESVSTKQERGVTHDPSWLNGNLLLSRFKPRLIEFTAPTYASLQMRQSRVT